MATTIRVKILTDCKYCNGSAYIPLKETKDSKGEFYSQYTPCKYCEGTGVRESSISLGEFVGLIEAVDDCEPDYKTLAEVEPVSQYVNSLEAAGIR